MAFKKYFLIVFILLVACLLKGVFCQKAKVTYKLPPSVQENDIVMSMLKIVDTKFDSITDRLSGLELAVQGLLQSNVRESRMVDRNLRGVNTIMQGVHDHLKQLDSQQGLLRKAVISMSTSVDNVYEKTTDFVKHFDYSGTDKSSGDISRLERNMAEQTTLIKETIEKTIDRQNQGLELERKQIRRSLVNVSDGVLLVDEKVDGIFNIIDKLSQSKQIREVNSKLDTVSSSLNKALARNSSQGCGRRLFGVEQSINEASRLLKNLTNREHIVQCPPHDPGKSEEIAEALRQSEELRESEDLSESENLSRESRQFDYRQIVSPAQWNLLFKTLANMTIDLAASINYYRHTGEIVEIMLSETSSFAHEQALTRKLVQEVLSVVSGDDFHWRSLNNTNLTSVFGNKTQNNVNFAEMRRLNTPDLTTHCENKSHTNSNVTEIQTFNSLIKNMSEVVKNGSQLLELLTEIAQLSTVSLAESSSQMAESIKKLKKLENSISLPTEAPLKLSSQSKCDEEILNNTRKTFQLLEAVSTSTGWIPYVYHKSRLLENKLNTSNKVAEKIYRKISDCEPFGSSYVTTTRATATTKQDEIKNEISKDGNSVYRASDRNSTTLVQSEKMDEVYITSLKVKRILPALTKLVAEPEPLYSLTNGSNPSQGRVEVYFKGRWGTICQENFGHREALTICRHLGYPGGVSAGDGYYGPGTGLYYALNITCLQTGWCASVNVVENPTHCNHDNDVSVICEHMIRFTHADENSIISAGTLQIYHEGRWNPICGYKWSASEARVACRQLGYAEGWVIDGGEAYNSETVWLSDVTCRGDEKRIDACEHTGWKSDGCRNSRAAAVACR